MREVPVVSTAVSTAAEPVRLGSYRATDLTALVGTVTWIGLVAAASLDRFALGTVDLFVALALLALVPFGFGLVTVPATRPARLAARGAIAGQLPAAGLAVLGLQTPVGSLLSVSLVLPWVGVTSLIALVGLTRVADRRSVRPLPALAVDAASLYVPVGAVALVFHRADVTFHFSPLIILLTVVHYNFAGFVLPLVAGRTGALVAGRDGRFGADVTGRIAAATTVVIVANLALIAVGITFSPAIEVVAVALFTVAVAGFAAVVLRSVVPTLPRLPGALLGLSAAVLFVTMGLALAYGYSAFPATGRLITITEMITWHGTLNAFGFAVPALLALRLLDRHSRDGEG